VSRRSQLREVTGQQHSQTPVEPKSRSIKTATSQVKKGKRKVAAAADEASCASTEPRQPPLSRSPTPIGESSRCAVVRIWLDQSREQLQKEGIPTEASVELALSLDEVREILETHESKIQLGNSPSAQIQDILGKRKDRDTPDDVTSTSKRARLTPVKADWSVDQIYQISVQIKQTDRSDRAHT
jgi:hypothetical protein